MLRLSMKETYNTIVPIYGHRRYEFLSMKNAILLCMFKIYATF